MLNRQHYAELFNRWYQRQHGRQQSAKQEELYRTALHMTQPYTYHRVLDAGCGDGYFTAMLHSLHQCMVWGLDVSSTIIERAQHLYPSLIFTVGDLRDMNTLFTEQFDLISCLDVLYYLPLHDVPQICEALYNQLTLNGHLLLIFHTCHAYSLTGTDYAKSNEHWKSVFTDSDQFTIINYSPYCGITKDIYLVAKQL